MRSAQILLWLTIAALGVSILGGCGKKKETEPIPITAVSQSMVDDDPDHKIEEPDEMVSPEYEVELPENPDSFALALWDEVYSIPDRFEAFSAMGWEYQGDAEKVLGAQTYSAGEIFEREGNQVQVDLVNPDTVDCAVKDAQIGGITIDTASMQGQGIYVTLPGKVILQESLLTDVLNLYGEPMDRYEQETTVEFTYEFGLYQSMGLSFEKETGVLYCVKLQNIMLSVDQEDLGEVSSEVTEEVRAYQTPTAESEKVEDYIVTYGGDLYQLPAPVSAFVEHGWKIDTRVSDPALAAGAYGSATLERDGVKIYGTIHNEGSAATTVENCFLTLLSGDLDAIRIPISIAGITLGMPEEELLARMKEWPSESQNEEEKKQVVYRFYTDETRLNYVEAQVDTTFMLVRGIRVTNQVRFVPREEFLSAPETPEGQPAAEAGTEQSLENADPNK